MGCSPSKLMMAHLFCTTLHTLPGYYDDIRHAPHDFLIRSALPFLSLRHPPAPFAAPTLLTHQSLVIALSTIARCVVVMYSITHAHHCLIISNTVSMYLSIPHARLSPRCSNLDDACLIEY